MLKKENMLNNDWRLMKFEDCILQLNTGLNPRSNFSLGKGNLKYITAKNLTKYGTVDFSKSDSIDEDAKRTINKRSDIQVGDILFSSRAPIGHCYLIKEEPNYYDIGESIFSIRVDKKVVIPEYLCLYLTSNFFVKLASKHTTGSIIQEIRIGDLMGTKVIVPPLKIQKDIADCLYRIDRKIALNDMLNDNLEQQLMLLYDYWFTQFDFPDTDGNPYQTSGGKMVWNDTLKRNIPENWKVQSVISNCLSSIIKPGVEIFNTKTYLATADVKGTSISTGTIVDYDGRESRANMQPSINSVWFAKMKNSIKHLYLNKEMQPIISSSILSTGFCGLQCNEISFEYIASYVSNVYFEIHKDMLAHGATQEAVNNDDLAGVHIIIPEDTVLRAYHEITQAIYAQISKNICENQELVKLRDWLLPMLMNGQATINN